MRALYLRIYLTVLTVLLVFALITGWLARYHIEREREQMREVWSERVVGFAALIGNSLPPASAPQAEQEAALLQWSQRLHLPLALDDAMGRTIAASPEISPLDATARRAQLTRTTLPDGRVLWVGRPTQLRDLREIRVKGSMPMGPPPNGMFDEAGPFAPPLGRHPAMHAEDRLLTPPNQHRLDDRRPPGIHPETPPQRPPQPEQRSRWRWALGPLGPLLNGPNPALNLLIAMGVLFVAVAVTALPLVRSLTRRLESLKRSVQRFGEGQLGHRVRVEGRDEIAAVAISFNDAAQRIEELVHSHRSLLANASHELRSPLARLKMAITLMDNAPPERRAELRREVDHDIRELDVLVDEVLLSSRLDARPELGRDPIDVMALAVEEASRVEAQIDLHAQAPSARLLGEERLVRRALRNLLENARRYGVDAQGVEQTVELQVDVIDARGKQPAQLVFTVSDRGPGVSEDQRERIFEPFYRLPGHAERAGGVGLGLALVKQIAERHGGSVRCEARPGGGSRFVLTLPQG